MPKATANLQETFRHELKTLPKSDTDEAGFVVVRRLTYGEKIQRRAMTGSMKVNASKGQKDFAGEMQLINEKATVFDFQHCIVDHNLTKDDEGTPLDFRQLMDIRSLDPRVGEEIDNILNELNNFDEDDEASGN